MNFALPSGLTAALLATLLPGLLPAQQTFKSGWYTDKTLGFKVKAPSKWRQIPTKPEEQWIVALFQSNREFTSKEGYYKKLLMRVIMFDKNVGKKEREENKKDGVIRFGRSLRYRDFKDYVKQTQGGGGFYFSVEKERKGGTPATIYEVKFEKMARAKRRIVAWEFKRQDVSFAVEFDIFEEHYKKLKSTMASTFRSFKFVDIATAEAADANAPRVEIPNREEWKKLSPIDRHKLRRALEDEQAKKLLDKLPKDWKVRKTKHFLVITHADAKFTKAVIAAGDACWAWLDKRFGKLSDEYVRRSIIRICRDADEYSAYHGGSGSWFSISFGSFSREVDELQFYQGEVMREQMSYMMRNLFSHYLKDKDDRLMNDAPDWLQRGLGGYLAGTVLKGRKVVFEPTVNERVAIAKLIQKGGFRKGKLKTPRELMNMTRKEQGELDKKKGESYYQLAHLVRFLEGPGRKHKLLAGKDFLVEYCRAAQAADDEYDKKNPSESRGYKEAETEEEEEQQAAERERRWKESAEAAAKADLGMLKLLNGKMCNWSDEDWASLQKAYARTCKK
ncbi:MAG: hypothetical protein ACYST0_12565 [Planctomycetota bacterium]|jgi:hypothetical protein